MVEVSSLRALLKRLLLLTASAMGLLGVAIGVFAVVMLITVNAAGQAEIRQGREETGDTHLLYLRPEYLVGDTQTRGLVTHADITALEEQVPYINAVALWDRRNVSSVELGGRGVPPPGATFSPALLLGKVKPALKEVMGLRLSDGRFIDAMDLQYNRLVCVIGARLYTRLGGAQVIGGELTIKKIRVDGAHPIRVTETYTIVGVLQAELPLLEALPLSDRAFWKIVPRLFDRPWPGRGRGMYNLRAFHALQREQSALGRLAINDSVFIPWMGDNRAPMVAPDTLVYLSVSVPAVPGSRRPVLDAETMAPARAELSPAPCEKCDDDLCRVSPIPYYMPQGLLDVANEMRAVLRARLGDDMLFQFLHMETLGDPVRFELRWLNRLLGVIIMAGFVLWSIPVIAGVYPSRMPTNGQGSAQANGTRNERQIRPRRFSGYARLCLFSAAIAAISGAAFSYWLVVMVLLW